MEQNRCGLTLRSVAVERFELSPSVLYPMCDHTPTAKKKTILTCSQQKIGEKKNQDSLKWCPALLVSPNNLIKIDPFYSIDNTYVRGLREC